jgi:hypothetical protein
MGSNLEARRAHLEKLVELAKRPEDRLRLKRTVALIRQAEVERAKRQAVDGAAWRYAMDRSTATDETGNTLDRLIQQLNLRSGALRSGALN